MRAPFIFFLIASLVLFNIQSVRAQYRATHEIDSVMDLSPAYLPTQYAKLQFIEFQPLNFNFIDTSMTVTHLFDPLLYTQNIYQNLGISGQAHQSMIFDYQREMGFLYQALPYPLFFKKQSDLVFYKLQTTYSKAAYTLSFLKENEIFAEFVKYMKGVTVSANIYATFNEGSFVNQTTRNLCGDFLIHYELPSSLFGVRASYIISDLTNAENGGILDINSFQKRDFETNAAYAVRSPRANSLITNHDLNLQTYINIKNKKGRYFGTITYDFQFLQTTMQYKDKEIDTIYPYYNVYHADDNTNDSLRLRVAKNAIQWSNFSPFKEMKSKGNFFHIAGGALYDYAILPYNRMYFNSFYLFARTHIRIFKKMDITGKFSYSLISDYSNNDIAAEVGISWTLNKEKEHTVGLNVNYFRNLPEYMMLYAITDNFRWMNTFNKQDILHCKAYWNYKKYSVSAGYYHIDDWVYLTEMLRPTQNKNAGHLLQFSTFIPFQYKNFGTTANLNLQYCTKDVIKVPLFAGKLSVYYIFELLKKRLKIQIGSDVMYNTTYFADAYLPVLHKFYNQDSHPVGNFVYFDINLTVRIDRINFFFRAGNMLPHVLKMRNFSTPNYPSKDYLMSIGINWRFFD